MAFFLYFAEICVLLFQLKSKWNEKLRRGRTFYRLLVQILLAVLAIHFIFWIFVRNEIEKPFAIANGLYEIFTFYMAGIPILKSIKYSKTNEQPSYSERTRTRCIALQESISSYIFLCLTMFLIPVILIALKYLARFLRFLFQKVVTSLTISYSD